MPGIHRMVVGGRGGAGGREGRRGRRTGRPARRLVTCVCPKCGYRAEKGKNIPVASMVCPACRTLMREAED